MRAYNDSRVDYDGYGRKDWEIDEEVSRMRREREFPRREVERERGSGVERNRERDRMRDGYIDVDDERDRYREGRRR